MGQFQSHNYQDIIKMKLADYVMDYIADLGVKQVFMVYGAAIGDFVDWFAFNDRMKYVCVMHEQAGAFAAETLTKVSGELGVTLVTSGPGGTNLLTGIANCWYDSIPNLYITGQIHSQFLRKDPSIRQVGFQENDIVAMAEPITKWAYMVKDPKEIKWALDKAIHMATEGRPGPVLLDIPLDVQKMEIVPDTLEGHYYVDIKCVNSTSHAEDYLDRLEKAERPVLLIGGGVHLANAVEEVRELGRVLAIPCIPTWNAVDIFTDDYVFYRGRPGTYGGPGRNFAIQNADLLLSIGSRIPGRMTGGVPSTFAREAYKFYVDVDPTNLDPELAEVPADVNIHCDAKVFIQELLKVAKKRKIKSFQSWLDQTKIWLEKYDTVLPEYYDTKDVVHPYVFIRELSKLLGPDDIIIADCGGNVVTTYQAFKTKFGQRLISSHGNSPMGYSFAGAIGACFSNPKGRVICLIGDGGFNVNIQELQTVKNYDLPIKTFILNNQCYGITKQYQESNFGGRYEAAGPKGYSPPDFLKIGHAYGIRSRYIHDHDKLNERIQRTLDWPGAIICNVNTYEQYHLTPGIVGWDTPIEDMSPLLPREEFKSNMFIPLVESSALQGVEP